MLACEDNQQKIVEEILAECQLDLIRSAIAF